MMTFHVGCYVVHKKLSELGAGEITKAEMGMISIRFASGVRNFSEAIVGAFLENTNEAPAAPPAAAKRKAVKKAPPVAAVAAAAAAQPPKAAKASGGRARAAVREK
jgi:hypothetical protein